MYFMRIEDHGTCGKLVGGGVGGVGINSKRTRSRVGVFDIKMLLESMSLVLNL